MNSATSHRSLRQIYPHRVDIVILILLAIVLLIVGLSLPILTVRKLWDSNTYSVITGIQNLWVEKYYILAVVVFLFSVIFPIAKLISLSVVWLMKLTDESRRQLIFFMEIFGKWSMLDVFVTAIIIVWVKLGALASARPEIGIYFFAASVLLTMVISSLQKAIVRHYGKS